MEFLLGGKFWETGHKNIVSGMVNKTIVWAPFAGKKGGSGWLGDGVVGVLGGGGGGDEDGDASETMV